MATQVDPWLDPEFPNVDFTQHTSQDLADGIIEVDENMHPEIVQNTTQPEETPTPEPEPTPAPVAVVEEEPESFDLPDGGSGTIEKTKKGWRVAIDIGAGGIQNFYGKTKNEAMINMAVAQANATKKIRDLNRKVKLSVSETNQPTQTQPQSARQLSDDDIFDLKTKFASNPDQAIEEWAKKKYGRTFGDIVRGTESGVRAARDLEIEGANREFLGRCPTWYADPNYENYKTLVAYLAKEKLGRALTEHNRDEILNELCVRGQYTAENLEEAFTDLNDSGLLLRAPQTREIPEPLPAPQQTTAPAQTNERIVRTETRPRAGLGIRNSEITPSVAPQAKKPLTAEDMENMSDEEIEKLIAIEKRRILSGRR